MGYGCPVMHLTLLLWILASLVYPSLQGSKETFFRQKRQEGCPIPDDSVWRYRNGLCPTGKKYHCLENGSFIEGCFKPEECISGARPIVEGSKVVCHLCPPGTFQPEDRLKTDRTVSSNCRSHSPCNPKYGKKECRAGTSSTDIGCMCDPDRGFSQAYPGRQECDCFTTNDFCNCEETGCANGTIKNAEGLCVPVTKEPKSQETPTSAPSTTTAPMTPTGKEDSASLATILTPSLIVAVVILIIIAVFYCWKRGTLNSNRATSSSNGNGNLHQTSIGILKADQVIFQNGTSCVKIGNAQEIVQQQGETNIANYIRTNRINCEDQSADRDNTLPPAPDAQTSAAFPHNRSASTTTRSSTPMSCGTAVPSTPGDTTTTSTVPPAPYTGENSAVPHETVMQLGLRNTFIGYAQGGRFSVTQQGLRNTYVRHAGTGRNSEDHPSDEGDHLAPEDQNSTRFPQCSFDDVQLKSSCKPSAPTSESDQNFEIVPSGAVVASHDGATSHAGENTVVSTSAASCSSATPIQHLCTHEQAPEAGPSAPPDETQHLEPSAPEPSLPYKVDTEADEGDQSESKAGPSASPDETPHPEPLAPASSMLYAVSAGEEEGDQSESEEDEKRRLLKSSETAVKSLQQLRNKETLHGVVLPSTEKQLLLKIGDNYA